MKKLFNNEQENFIVNNYEIMKYSEIADYLGNGITAQQINGWLHNNGYKKSNRFLFSENEKKYIENNYLNKTYASIANHIGYTEKQVRHYINHYLDKKNREFDDRYFQYIDTPTKAYWIGYIYADGYITQNKEQRMFEFGMQLQKLDRKVLEDLNNELGGVHTITESHFEGVIYHNKNKSITDSVRLRVYSKNIVNDLISHNILPNKTYQPEYPIIEKYFLDFLRGYIDGDGCIYINKKKYLTIHITSFNQYVLKYISEKLFDKYNLHSYVYKENDRKYRFFIHGCQAAKLLDLLYYNKNVQKLDRKYQKYLLLKQEGSPYKKLYGNKSGKIGEAV